MGRAQDLLSCQHPAARADRGNNGAGLAGNMRACFGIRASVGLQLDDRDIERELNLVRPIHIQLSVYKLATFSQFHWTHM